MQTWFFIVGILVGIGFFFTGYILDKKNWKIKQRVYQKNIEYLTNKYQQHQQEITYITGLLLEKDSTITELLNIIKLLVYENGGEISIDGVKGKTQFLKHKMGITTDNFEEDSIRFGLIDAYNQLRKNGEKNDGG